MFYLVAIPTQFYDAQKFEDMLFTKKNENSKKQGLHILSILSRVLQYKAIVLRLLLYSS